MNLSSFSKIRNLLSPLGILLAYFLIVQGPLTGLVMCFGGPSHIAVEVPHNNLNHPTPESQKPCLDVPLISVGDGDHHDYRLIAALRPAPQNLLLVLAPSAAFLPVYPDVQPSGISPRGTKVDLLAVFLRPVILLI